MIAKGNGPLVSLDIIRNYVSDFEILRYYLGVTTIPIVINSPLREDKNPSFSLFTLNKQDVLVKDFATGYHDTLIGFLCLLWKVSYEECLVKIYQDIDNIKKETNKVLKISQSTSNINLKASIQVKVREWQSYDLEYWESYGISLNWLKFGKIYPISHIFITKNKVTNVFAADKYSYAYVEFKDQKYSFKVYQPFNKRYKWFSGHDHSVWDLWNQLPQTGDNLIITSSRKDALSIWENSGIPSCSLQAESYWPKPQVIQELKSRFKKIFILYDNDFTKEVNHGRLYGTAIAKQFSLIQIELPLSLGAKDSSDLCKLHGRKILHQTILNLIQHENCSLWHP